MGATVFVIFCFGLVITGIVFLGVQQAADWARVAAAQKAQAELSFKLTEVVSPAPSSPPVSPRAAAIHP